MSKSKKKGGKKGPKKGIKKKFLHDSLCFFKGGDDDEITDSDKVHMLGVQVEALKVRLG